MNRYGNRDPDTLPLLARIIVNTLCVIFLLGIVFNTLVLINNHFNRYDYATGFGFTPIAVVSDEEDAPKDLVNSGDLLFAMKQRIEKYKVGDTVAYWANGTLLIGRISYIEGDPADPDFFVRAAFSQYSYATPATVDNLLGAVKLQIPYLGYFILFLTTLVGRLLFVGIPFLIYCILLLVEIRRERAEEAEFERDLAGLPVPMPVEKPDRANVDVRAAKRMAGLVPWGWLTTIVITVAAIGFGTADSRRTDKASKKVGDGLKAKTSKPPFFMPQELPRCRTKTLRPVRAVRALTTRQSRPIKVIRPCGANDLKR